MSSPVRVRFAPSPTGDPHLGNIRTALFNWFFARRHGGKFILRVEDTDQARKVPGATDAIFAALRWLNIDWDEGPEVGGEYGPYYQSERLEIYHSHAKKLIDQGEAYYCYCGPERLDGMRKQQQANKQPPGYDRHCRDLDLAQLMAWGREQSLEGREPVVRFKMPLEGTSVIADQIRGNVSFDLSLLDDFIILKSDGYPTYHLANVVDDHLMDITHVLRAEEWLSSAPRHKELYRALDYKMPHLAHLPIILGPDKSKLSKRHGATSVLDYRDNGYLPEALVNFLVLLGWSLDDRTEMFDQITLAKSFGLDRVSASPAIFNKEKLDWFNGIYMRALTSEELAEKALPYLNKGLPDDVGRPLDNEYVAHVIPLVHERLRTLSEAPELTDYFFREDLQFNPLDMIQKGMDRFTAQEALLKIIERLNLMQNWDQAALENLLRPLADELELSTGQLFGTIRVGITGRKAAPPLFETMEVLGKDRCLTRLQSALKYLKMLPIAC